MGKVRYRLVLVVFFLASLQLWGKTAQDSIRVDTTAHRISPLKELQADISAILDNSDFANSVIGVSVLSLETGKYLYRKNESKNLIPASTLKLITTSAALDYLGPDFKFKTGIYLDGKIEPSGEYQGNIIVRGSGDPSMSTYFTENPLDILERYVSCLDSLGIRSIRGNIIGDDKYFDKNYYAPGWAWDDFAYPYSAEVNAISIFDNKVDVILKASDSVGQPPSFTIVPENSYIQIINNIRTVPGNINTEIIPVRESRTNVIELRGVIALDTTSKLNEIVSVTIDNPTMFFLHLFRQVLKEHKISHRGALLDIDDLNEKIIYTNKQAVCAYTSPPLSEIVSVINKRSHNLAADMLLKTIGKEVSGVGSFAKGAEQVRTFLSKNGVTSDGISIVDGSGLSRFNLISPKNMINLLSAMYRSDYRDLFMSSLATPGTEGTLKRRMTHSRAEKNVIAKSGSMTNVSTLCGYIKTRDNETLAFSIMIMNYTVPPSLAQNLQDLICMRLASFSRKGF